MLLCGLSVGCVLTPGFARADADDDAEPQAGPAPPPPRLTLHNRDYEVVAEALGSKLMIHLDRFEDNAPVDGATVQVAVEDWTYPAEPVAKGIYQVTGDWVAASGPHELTLTATTADGAFTLSGTLVIPEPKAEGNESSAKTGVFSGQAITLPIDVALALLIGVVAALGGSAFVVFRRGRSYTATEPPVAKRRRSGSVL